MATYTIDPAHSTVSFSVRHLMISKVHGAFEKLSGKLVYDKADPAASSVEVEIDTSSINTREPQRDGHLRSPDFFDAAKFPTITFKSTKVAKDGDALKLTGDLTLHGVTKEVTLDVEAPSDEQKDLRGNTKLGASATTKIKRKDFGLVWNAALETGGVAIGDDVSVSIDLQFAKAA